MSGMSRRTVGVLAVLILALGAVTTIDARTAVVTLNDGRQVTGDLVAQDENGVTLMVNDIRQVIPSGEIRGIEYPRTLEEQYKDRRAKVADDNLQGRLDIVRWLINSDGGLELAAREIGAMQQVWPGNEDVALFKRVVDERLRAQREAEAAATDPGDETDQPVGDDDDDDDAGPSDATEHKMLTDEQINMIRIYEIDLTEKPIVRLDADLIDLMIKAYPDMEFMPKGQSQIRAYKRKQNQDSHEVLADLFRIAVQRPDAVALYPKVTVTQDPPVMLYYRRHIQRSYVVNYCGSCHGVREGGAGNLMLFTRQAADTDTVYTNFFILNEHQSNGARMIDRDAPERSLLLQYGLPRDVAVRPHPEVDEKATGRPWRPYFRNGLEDPRFEQFRRWIAALWRPAPDYRVNYTPPKPAAAAEEPASTDAASPATP